MAPFVGKNKWSEKTDSRLYLRSYQSNDSVSDLNYKFPRISALFKRSDRVMGTKVYLHWIHLQFKNVPKIVPVYLTHKYFADWFSIIFTINGMSIDMIYNLPIRIGMCIPSEDNLLLTRHIHLYINIYLYIMMTFWFLTNISFIQNLIYSSKENFHLYEHLFNEYVITIRFQT